MLRSSTFRLARLPVPQVFLTKTASGLLSGEAASLKEIARVESVTPAYARRVIRTAFLAPDLKAAILDGCQPAGLSLEAVIRSEMPLDWDASECSTALPDRRAALPLIRA
jgi:hypothetical protein